MLLNVMTEEQMQKFANEKEGFEVEFLPEYATKLGYEVTLKENENGEYYVFTKKNVDTQWSLLSQAAKTILERVDVNRAGLKLEKDVLLEIPYFKGIVTEELIEEIKLFEKTEENEGYFKTQKIGDVLLIEFLKSPF